MDDYPTFKTLNQRVIKPAIQEINTLTHFFVEIEPKRIGRKIGELKFRLSRLKEMPTVQPMQETFSFDIDDLPSIAIKLVQAGVSRKAALRIAEQAWEAVDASALPDDSGDFAVYVEEKIGLAQQATDVKNMGGFIVKAIRENYEDPVFQKELQVRKAEEREVMLASLRNEMLEKRNALIRQAVRARPELLEEVAAKITSSFIRERLMEYDSVKDAYEAGGMVAGEVNSILAEGFCADLIAPVVAVYEAEREGL